MELESDAQSPTQSPTPDLLQMVYALVAKVENLETELKTIKEQMANRQRGQWRNLGQGRDDIIEQRNQPERLVKDRDNIPPFSKWIKDTVLPSVKDHLDIVFQNDIVYGIIRLLENNVSRGGELAKLPIRVFERRGNHTYFYIFDGDNRDNRESLKWKRVPFHEMESHTWEIYQRFNKDFYNHWCVPNEARIANMDDEYSKLYIDYFKAILGNTNMSHDKRNYKICSLFYKKMAELE